MLFKVSIVSKYKETSCSIQKRLFLAIEFNHVEKGFDRNFISSEVVCKLRFNQTFFYRNFLQDTERKCERNFQLTATFSVENKNRNEGKSNEGFGKAFIFHIPTKA